MGRAAQLVLRALLQLLLRAALRVVRVGVRVIKVSLRMRCVTMLRVRTASSDRMQLLAMLPACMPVCIHTHG